MMTSSEFFELVTIIVVGAILLLAINKLKKFAKD
jgi:hypothetical protein